MRFDPLPAHNDSEALDESLVWIHQVAAEVNVTESPPRIGGVPRTSGKGHEKLPPRIAQVFQLYSIEECTNQEVCGQLNISESNLWVMLHRARKQLSEALAGWRDGDHRKDR
jgi:hypothetical protein